MLNLAEVVEELSSVFEKPVAEKLGQVMLSVYERLHESMVLQRLDAIERRLDEMDAEWRRAMNELTSQLAASRMETEARFRELATAQFSTEERLQQLTARVDQLTEQMVQLTARVDQLTVRVDQLTEQMVQLTARVDQLTVRVDQLTEQMVQLTARVDQLTVRVDQLTEQMVQLTARVDQLTAQMEQLAEAQRRTEERVTQLAEALLRLAERVGDLQKQVGGLSQTVGYVLENEAMKKLPDLLLRDYGLRVEGRLKRQYVQDKRGRHIEVNVFGTARRNGDTVTIVGESKSQLSKNDIDRFLARTVRELEGLYPQLFPVIITHMISEPDAEQYARELGVALYYSYEF